MPAALWSRALPALLVLGLLAGCGALVDEPPSRSPVGLAPAIDAEADAAEGIVRVRVPALARDGYARRAAALTVRVRNLTCSGLGTGSGFAVDAATLITNRHVVEGARRLEVNLADGRTLTVSAAEIGLLGDVAFVTVDGTLPVIAEVAGHPAAGSRIAAVGYPLGGRLAISDGTIVDRIDGGEFAVPGPILRTTADVQPGNSGGPLLDGRGRVVAVVYAIEIATGFSLAIPMSTVDRLLAAGGTQALTTAGTGEALTGGGRRAALSRRPGARASEQVMRIVRTEPSATLVSRL